MVSERVRTSADEVVAEIHEMDHLQLDRVECSIVRLAWHRSCLPARLVAVGHWAAVSDRVSQDEREWEEEDAKQEEPDEAVAFAVSDAGGPKGEGDPDDGQDDPENCRHAGPLPKVFSDH
jgi:hypothetical protein